MSKHGEYVAMAVALLLAIVIVLGLVSPILSLVKPAQVEAVKNRQVDGMILWGTSGMSRLYGDLWVEKFEEDDSRFAKHEANQHLWASYHDESGAGYGYFDNGKWGSNYQTVVDAPSYAVLANARGGWSHNNTNDLRVSDKQMTLDAITPMLDGAKTTGAANGKGPWELKKTKIVLWAGEDWVVRNKMSSDTGVARAARAPEVLEKWWMGSDVEPYSCKYGSPSADYSYFDHYFDPFPNRDARDAHGDVMHSYKDDNGQAEVPRSDPLCELVGAHYGKEFETDVVEDEPNVTVCQRLDGSTAVSGYHHTYVHENSYQITDGHLGEWLDDGTGYQDLSSGFSYKKDEDGLDLTLTHKLTDATDKLDDNVSLGTQTGETFGRQVGGYSYTVEYLVQDPEKTSEMVDEPYDEWVWIASYEPAHDEALPETTTTFDSDTDRGESYTETETGTYTDSARDGRTYPTTVTHTTVLTGTTYHTVTSSETVDCSHCVNGKVNCKTCNGTGTVSNKTCTTCHGTGRHCDFCDDTGSILCFRCDGSGRLPTGRTCPKCNGSGSIECARCDGGIDKPRCGTCNGTGHVTGTCPTCHGHKKVDCGYCNGTGSVTSSVSTEVPTYHYTTTTSVVVHYPPTYRWTKEKMTIHTRCDEDLAPDPGYADSWHEHMYGGMGGIGSVTEEEAGEGLPDESDTTVEHIDTESGHVGNWGSGSDHSNDYVRQKTWFTNPDKPIMKAVTESRHVRGYAEFWKNQYSTELQIYIFGLGPYNKSDYEDQKDEWWDDGKDLMESARDINGDGELTLDEQRCITNNKNTVSLPSSLPGPDFTAEERKEWVLGQSSKDENVNWWDTHQNGQGTSGHLDEIARTNRIDSSRKDFNAAVKSSAGAAKFMDMWDLLYEHKPYYRYRAIKDSSIDDDNNAQHGKWYDKNTYNWIFHMMWATILNDNPNPDDDAMVDVSFYTASSALTAYANKVVSPAGRTDESVSSGVTHNLLDILAAGPANAGGALGYGDSNMGFEGHIASQKSESSVTVDYASLIGLENASSGHPGSGSSMYLYSRYGRLLADLGLDKTDDAKIVSPRLVPGIAMSGAYLGNGGLSVVWKFTMEALKGLNPFQILANATEISTAAKNQMYDGTNGWLVKLAANNAGFRKILEEIGTIYDTLTGVEVVEQSGMHDPFDGSAIPGGRHYHFSITMIYLVFFIAGSLLCYNVWKSRGQHWSKLKTLLIRVAFIAIGVPLFAIAYTAVLNGVDDFISVTASPASQMVASTYVDFGGWVRNGRLSPTTDGVFISEANTNTPGGYASEESFMALRKTAWSINKATGALPDVDMSVFAGGLDDYETWDTLSYDTHDATDSWGAGLQSTKECFDLLKAWMHGEFYYASDFESESISKFVTSMPDAVGRRVGGAERERAATGEDPAPGEMIPVEVDNSNTLHQMFDSTNELDDWLNRSIRENTELLTGSGAYGASSASSSGETTDWHLFNIYANGTLEATPSDNVTSSTKVTYSDRNRQLDPEHLGTTMPGLSLTSKVGLSTLSMYNYLSTSFDESSMTMYSSVRNNSTHTLSAHYKVNMIGSGAMAWIFFLNCFVFMAACVIIGFVYALGMLINVIKNGFHAIMEIPGAMLGVLNSIVRFAVTVLTMIVQVIGTILMYQVVADLLLTLVSAFETPLWERLRSVEASAVPGGILAFVSRYMPNLCGSLTGFMTYLFGISVIMIVVGYKACRLAPAFLRVHSKATVLLYAKLLPQEQAIEYVCGRTTGRAEAQDRRVPVFASIRYACKELLEM